MEQIQRLEAERVRGCTVFYFTDNSTTYYIAQANTSRAAHLHALIEKIRLLELELQCHLQVVHVPGLVMIDQGTDSLSRGVWCSPLHSLPNQTSLAAEIFAPSIRICL